MNANIHTIFSPTSTYRVIPMHPGVEAAAQTLSRAFVDGVTARQDPARKNFYSAEVNGLSCYFHLYPENKTAYLIWSEVSTSEVAPLAPLAPQVEMAVSCTSC